MECCSSERIGALHEAGTEVAVDGFRAGYFIAELKKFAVDTVKIHHSLAHDNLGEASSQKALQAINVMAHTLGVKVIAEGSKRRINEIVCRPQAVTMPRAICLPTRVGREIGETAAACPGD